MTIKEKCIIWGMGYEYETILNQIHFEIYKGNIEIVAIVCRKEDRYCEYKDGFPVVLKEEMMEMDFDYVIISSSLFYKEIRAEAIELGIGSNKIINGQILKNPLFDFKLYSKLIKNPVTIISDDCWGGFVYKYLGLEASSPLINTLWGKDAYSRFIQEPLFYLQTELTMVRDGDLRKGIHPIGMLGESGKYVQINFIHNIDFNEVKQQWDRRKKRINQDNIFVKMGFDISDENINSYIDAFNNCKYNKILFYKGDEDIKGKCDSDRIFWYYKKYSLVHTFSYPAYMRSNYMFVIDILKLLTGEKDYSRESRVV